MVWLLRSDFWLLDIVASLGGKKVLLVGSQHQIDLGDRFAAIGHSSNAMKMMAKLRVKAEPNQCIASDGPHNDCSSPDKSVLTYNISYEGGMKNSSSEMIASGASSDEGVTKNIGQKQDENMYVFL